MLSIQTVDKFKLRKSGFKKKQKDNLLQKNS